MAKNIIIISLFLIPLITSLDLTIVDDYFIQVGFGGQKKPLKLMIDPVGHFTYIFKDIKSPTKTAQGSKYTFSNNFGSFSGEWESDYIFPTPDQQFGFRFTYLMVKDKKDSVFECDGVIGLGYHHKIVGDDKATPKADPIPDEANIYNILGEMKDLMQVKNVMTYDKDRKKLVLGRIPDPDSYNPVSFDIKLPDPKYQINLVTLDKIGFYPKDSKKPFYIKVSQNAKIGLMPVLIAPSSAKKLLNEQIIAKMTNDQKSIKEIVNDKKFFNDIAFKEPSSKIKKQGLMMFGKIGYKFDHTWVDGENYSSAIRLGDKTEALDYWYIGIDKLNVNRMDFNFNTNKVILYSTTAAEIGKTKYPYLIKALIITIVATILCIIIVRCCCSKKVQKEIKEGEELLYL